MPLTEFFPDRQPRREDQQFGHMTVWQILLQFIAWVNKALIRNILQGTATVPNAATTLDVVHSFGSAAYREFLTPTVDPGGRYWVTGKTASKFTINLGVAAPVGGISFDWMLKGD